MPLDVLPGTIGLVTSSLDADYSRRLVAGVTEVLIKNGYSPLCFSPGASATTEYQIPVEFLDLVDPQRLAGLIFTPPSVQFVDVANQKSDASTARDALAPSYDLERFLNRLGDLPRVCIGAGLAGMPGVWVQNGAGIRLLMQHLVDCGRRRIAFVRGPEQNVEAMSRFRAWEDFCFEHSLPRGEELVESGDFTPASGEAAAFRILKRNPREPPDAFVVSNDRMAVGVLRAMRSKGLTVPHDVSVVGFDDLEADSAEPPLTTIRQPVFEMGHRAAEVLVAMLKKESVSTEHMFPPKLVIRASSRPGQRRALSEPARFGSSNSVFLESAYPSEKLLLPALRARLKDVQTRSESKNVQSEPLVVELEADLQRAKAREQDLVAGIRRMRAHAVEHLDQVLSSIKTLQAMHVAILTYLRFIGMQGLTVALRGKGAHPQSSYRLVIACDVASDEPVQKLGTQHEGAQLLAAHAQEGQVVLRIVQPLYCEDQYCGILIANGILLDNQLLSQLGTVLVRATMRIGKPSLGADSRHARA